MSQRTNRKTKLKKKIDEQINLSEKYLINSEYKAGVIAGLKRAKEIIDNG